MSNPQCKHCAAEIHGRTDKQYCNDYCRTSWHNARNQQETNFTRNITSIIKRNRSKLKDFVTRQINIITKKDLDEKDFNWNYHTHCVTDRKGKVITFCFEYGFQLIGTNKVKIIDHSKS